MKKESLPTEMKDRESHQPTTDYKAAILDRERGLKELLKGVVPMRDGRVRTRILKLLTLTADGETWKNASMKSGISWPQLSALRLHHPEIHELWKAAQECGEGLRQIQREEEADRRGVEGWLEPMFDLKNGRVIGEIRRFSDRLLETKLKAGNPKKYSDKQRVEHVGTLPATIHYHIHGVTLGQQPPPKTYNLPDTSAQGSKDAEDAKGTCPDR